MCLILKVILLPRYVRRSLGWTRSARCGANMTAEAESAHPNRRGVGLRALHSLVRRPTHQRSTGESCGDGGGPSNRITSLLFCAASGLATLKISHTFEIQRNLHIHTFPRRTYEHLAVAPSSSSRSS